MSPSSRSPRRRRVAFAGAILFVLLTSSCGDASRTSTAARKTAGTTTSTAIARSTTTNQPALAGDAITKVGTASLHIRCVGDGAATVVLIPGFGDALSKMSGLETALAPSARVCSYDRYGNGTSDAPPEPQTFSIQAENLHQLLVLSNVPGPYLLVAHSLGGPEAVTFASAYRDEVIGMLLLDGTPANWGDATCGIKADGTTGTQSMVDFCAAMRDPLKNQEHLDSAAAYSAVSRVRSLGDLPLVADTAINDDYVVRYGLGPADVATLKAEWLKGQNHWVSLSTNSRLQSVKSSHDIYLEHPDLVVRQIQQLLVGSTAE